MKISRLFLILLFTPLIIFSQNKKKLALVIGNSNYSNTLKLENPVNDARLIASSLKEVNFEVILKEDVTKKELSEAIEIFLNKLIDTNYEAGFFYYAGHGIQVENTNYLVPIDTDIENIEKEKVFNAEIAYKCYSVQSLLEDYSDNERLSNKVLISVLDACRNNPFKKNRSIGEGGLSKINAVSGSLIAYSTEPGKVALDGKGKKNSIYSEVLAKILKTPNLTLEEVFKEVRTEVEKQSNKVQSPREESALKGAPFYFITNKNKKIDIVGIESEFLKLISSHSYKKAISKGNVLKEIYSQLEDSISRTKYIDLLMQLSTANYQYLNEEIENTIFNREYTLEASKDLLEVINLLKKEGINRKENEYKYSKSLINYIFLQLNILEKNKPKEKADLSKYLEELIDFNEKKYGIDNYYTACSYFLTGWFNRDSSNTISYQYFNKAFCFFKNHGFENNYDESYFYFKEIPNLVIMWNILSINNAIKSDSTFSKMKIKQKSNYNSKEFYSIINSDIQESIKFISKYKRKFNWLFINQATKFYMNYSVINKDSSTILNSLKNALNLSELLLSYSDDTKDSIDCFLILAEVNFKLLEITKKKDYIKIDQAFDLIIKSIEASERTINTSSFLCSIEKYLDYLLNFDNKECNNLKLNKFINVVNRFSKYLPNYISDYKSKDETYKISIENQIKNIFKKFKTSINNIDSIDNKYKLKIAEHNIEVIAISITDGFGSLAYIEALENKAEILETGSNLDELTSAKYIYDEIIKLIVQFNKSWNRESMTSFFSDTFNIEECTTSILSDAYCNYSNNIMLRSYHENNFIKDSSLITSFQNFLIDNDSNLKNICKYYVSVLSYLKSSILFNKFHQPEKAVNLCDSAIVLINQISNNNKINSHSISSGITEEKSIWFYEMKKELLKNKN